MRITNGFGTALAISFATLLSAWTQSAHAIRNPDMSGDDQGAIAIYTFDEMGGTVANDSSGVGSPLNLNMSVDGNLPTADGTVIRTNASMQSGYLLVNPKPNGAQFGDPDSGYEGAQLQRTFLTSGAPAAKLNSCTGGFTVQAFLRPWFPFQGSQSGNLIVGLSNSNGKNTVVDPNFGVYQAGQTGAESIMLKVRTASGSVNQFSVAGAFSSVRETDNPGALTEVIATQEPNGVLTVYVNRIPRSSLSPVSPLFDQNAQLVIGNELVPLTLKQDGTANVSQQMNWSGEIYHLAIYCQGFTRNQILGATQGNTASQAVVSPQAASAITPTRLDARRLVERLTGVVVPIDHPMVLKVEAKLVAGDRLGAAKIVTGDNASAEPGHPEFLNTVVKQFAMQMSNRDETIRAPFNDFAAAFIGETRDERNAKELLTDNFFYMADPAKVTVRSNIFNDILVSNNHYQDLESGNWDIGKVLMRVSGQLIATDVTGTTMPHPDPAGVLTSRAFMSAHAIAGTNRRLVEYTFREFMCIPMIEMADTSASPARIGRDVDRQPGGDGTKFETTCKGCHTQMDGFRGAFAHFDFANLTVGGGSYGVVRHTEISGSGSLGFSSKDVDQFGTVTKMNHNETVFPNGYVTTDNSFINNAVGPVNGPRFGWGGAYQIGGVGAHQFGQLIADSTRFSQCMAKRVYEAVCTPGQTSGSVISPLVDGYATKFRAGGYNLKSLFQIVASDPACTQGMGR